MKNFWIVIGTLLVLANLVNGGEVFDEWVIPQFDEREWLAQSISTSEDNIVTISYLLKGESSKSWSEAINTKFYPVKPNSKVIEFFHDYYRDTVMKGCQNLQWVDEFRTETQIISSWDQAGCQGSNNTGYVIASFMAGTDGVHIVIYSAKEKSIFEKQKLIWLELLKKTKIFTPDESKKNLRTSLLSDSTKMMHVTYRYESAEYPKGSFLILPKDTWRSSLRYARTEESPDSLERLQVYIIINEPDVWMINLFDSSGMHTVDKGPTFNTRCPVISEVQETAFTDLEIGTEQTFFDYYGARILPDEVINSVSCKVYELPRFQAVLRFYVRKENNLPYAIKRRESDKSEITVYYDEYTTNLNLDRDLFTPLKNFKYEER